jgi:hypothetical protein
MYQGSSVYPLKSSPRKGRKKEEEEVVVEEEEEEGSDEEVELDPMVIDELPAVSKTLLASDCFRSSLKTPGCMGKAPTAAGSKGKGKASTATGS